MAKSAVWAICGGVPAPHVSRVAALAAAFLVKIAKLIVFFHKAQTPAARGAERRTLRAAELRGAES